MSCSSRVVAQPANSTKAKKERRARRTERIVHRRGHAENLRGVVIRIGGMKILASVLCLALGAAWVRPARAEEARPTFEGLEPGPDAAETYRLNSFTIVHEEISGS